MSAGSPPEKTPAAGAVPLAQIRSDFDHIARLAAERPEPGDPYEPFLLRLVPERCGDLLEVGCGMGRLSRALAARARSVIGIDLSDEMIRVARERGRDRAGLRFVCDDFLTHPFGDARFDCILSMALFHHLPAAPALDRMKSLLSPGGVLILHDVRAPESAADWVRSGVEAVATGQILGWLRRRLGESGALRRAWRDHGARDRYATIREVHALCRAHLPGARVFRHPLWRYTVTWIAP